MLILQGVNSSLVEKTKQNKARPTPNTDMYPGAVLCSPPAPDTFCPKKFFQACGLTQKSPQDVKKAFAILDNDGSGFIEEEELKWVELAASTIHRIFLRCVSCWRGFDDSAQSLLMCLCQRGWSEGDTRSIMSLSNFSGLTWLLAAQSSLTRGCVLWLYRGNFNLKTFGNYMIDWRPFNLFYILLPVQMYLL